MGDAVGPSPTTVEGQTANFVPGDKRSPLDGWNVITLHRRRHSPLTDAFRSWSGLAMPDTRLPFSLARRSAAFRVALALGLSAVIWAGVLLVLG
jgi:hypothetical protein